MLCRVETETYRERYQGVPGEQSHRSLHDHLHGHLHEHHL